MIQPISACLPACLHVDRVVCFLAYVIAMVPRSKKILQTDCPVKLFDGW